MLLHLLPLLLQPRCRPTPACPRPRPPPLPPSGALGWNRHHARTPEPWAGWRRPDGMIAQCNSDLFGQVLKMASRPSTPVRPLHGRPRLL